MIPKCTKMTLALLFVAFASTVFAAKPQDPITPFAEVHADTTVGPGPLNVQFTARGSFDPDNGPLTYSWDFGDGNTATGLDVVHEYPEGFYVAVLTVTDLQGLFDVASVEIRVRADTVPVVAITASPSSGTVPLTVDFSATVFGGDGTLTYDWDFGDGDGSSIPNPSHTYVDIGLFSATATVTDEDGDTAFEAVEIYVASQ